MKFRPVEGRSIEDVKAGDLVRNTEIYSAPKQVIHLDKSTKTAWLRHINDLAGWIQTMSHKWQIVEPIPEPKIEVTFINFDGQGHVTSEFSDLRDLIKSPHEVIIRLTRIDGKITAVELVKDEE